MMQIAELMVKESYQQNSEKCKSPVILLFLQNWCDIVTGGQIKDPNVRLQSDFFYCIVAGFLFYPIILKFVRFINPDEIL